MKTISAQLQAFLLSGEPYTPVDLITIQLRTGVVIRVCTGQVSVNYEGNTYFASSAGAPTGGSPSYGDGGFGTWERGQVTSEASFALEANDMTLTMYVGEAQTYPGTSQSLLSTVVQGLWDKASVFVQTVYYPAGEYGINSMGTMTLFAGQITNFQQSGRSRIDFKVSDYFYLLDEKVPVNMYQAGCRKALYDQNCTLIKSNFLFATTATGSSTGRLIYLTDSVTTASWWNGVISPVQGSIFFTSGQNIGQEYTIQSMVSDTVMQLNVPPLFPVSSGDNLDLFPGCAKTQAACNGYVNIEHYGGTDYAPVPETLL